MMKRRNRLIAVLLALVCIIPCMAVPTYAAEAETEAAETTDTAQYRLLKALGIFEETEDFSGVTSITRGQFISYVLRMYGRESYLGEYENPFSDLDSAHERYEDIISAFYLGLINGSGGAFRPDDDITWAEAAKILMGLLGYGAVCEANGGYPNGYVAQAGTLRMFPNNIASETSIEPTELFKLLVNALDTELCQVTSTEVTDGGMNYDFEVLRGKTLLSEAHEVYGSVGIVGANRFTTLYGGVGCGKDKVRIGGIDYRIGETNASDLLGHKVDFYYKNVDEERVLVFAEVSPKDTTVTVAADDISAAKTTTRKLTYWDSETGKEEHVDISAAASMIWNGGQQPIDKSLICPADGSVTLVDSNSDGDAEVVLVTSFRTIRVSSISNYDYTIADLFGGDAIAADPTDTESEVIIERNGKTATFADIAKNDIVSYAESSGNKVKRKYLVVSSQTAQGEVTEADEKSVVIGGKSYRVMSRLTPSDMMGKSGTFYLNYNGWVADWDRGQDAVYGFLNKVGYKDGAFAHTLQAQIYTQNDRWVELDFANRVTFNGESVYSKEIEFPADTETGGLARQLITYTVNSEGKIDMMQFAKEIASEDRWTDEELSDIRNGVFRLSREYSKERYRSASRSFNGDVSLASDAKIFCVPKDASAEKDEFFMSTTGALGNDNEYTNVKLYDVTEGGLCKVCVIDAESVTGGSTTGSLTVVAGITKTVTSDGTSVPALQFWMGKEKVSLPVESQSVLDSAGGINVGDAVTYTINSRDNISYVSKKFDSTLGFDQKTGPANRYGLTEYAAGYVRSYADDYVRFEAAGDQLVFTTSNLGTVYIYDVKDNTMTKGTKSDLREGTYGVVYLSYLRAYSFIIYK